MKNKDALLGRIELGLKSVCEQVALFDRLFGNVDSQWKEDRSRVTEADLTISHEVERAIHSAFPEDDFFSEETKQDEPVPFTSEFAWIIDPVDGTNNFALGMPMCAISLGLLRHGKPVYGFIYDNARKKLMHGGKGLGAFDGDRPMIASSRIMEDDLYFAFDGFASDRMMGLFTPLSKKGFKIRNLGSGTLHLAYSCNGLFDGSLSNRVNIWDIISGIALGEAMGNEFHFLDDSIFPMKEFSVNAPKIYYYAGTPAFCRKMEAFWK